MHIITNQVLCGFPISPKRIILSVLRPNLIPWIIRKVLLKAKVKMFPLPTISKMSDLFSPLSLDMPK
jgi:hypothetical protein